MVVNSITTPRDQTPKTPVPEALRCVGISEQTYFTL
jgi:hypothetical protein